MCICRLHYIYYVWKTYINKYVRVSLSIYIYIELRLRDYKCLYRSWILKPAASRAAQVQLQDIDPISVPAARQKCTCAILFFFPFFLLARLSHPSPNSQNLTVDRDRVRFIGRVGPPPRGVPRDQAVVWLGMVSAGAVSRSRSYDAWGRRPSLSNARWSGIYCCATNAPLI